MNFYLSSQGVGNEEQKLKNMTKNSSKQVALINNAMDFMTDMDEKSHIDASEASELERLGFTVDNVDLKQYFNNREALENTLAQYDVIWVRGGNTFILAQAIALSGFDDVVRTFYKDNKNILYGGYSAGICMLGPTLEGLHLVDDPNQKPYGEDYATVWDGLNILDYTIIPHYQSNVPDQTVTYMTNHNIPFKTLKDGEVIIIE
ncbi:hypothetical protein GCM10028778_17110 [Barrientosiimonas marina]|uniref:Type 1 glutamine amidotransferase-like domain-containing protein n=1 Tax=Lentibacillus kimchii TaxID=1542911 RepID=A0ABW2UXK1_9BACI